VAGNPRIDDLRKRLEKDPGSRLFAQLAEELRKDGDLEEAINVCREGLKRQPAYPSARMTLGRALFDTGDVASARAEFETVLKGAPDNILASRLLGECLEGLGDLAGAARQYKTTLALVPGDKQVQAHLDEVEKRMRAPAPPRSVAAPTIMMPAPAPTASGAAPRSFEPAVDTSPDRYPRPAEPPPEEPPPPPSLPDRDFAPIPLVAADETFELEAAHESTPTKVGGGSASAVGGDWVVGIAMPQPPPQADVPSAPASDRTYPMPLPKFPMPEPAFPMPEEPPTVEEPPPAPAAEEDETFVDERLHGDLREDFAEEFAPPAPEPPRLPPLQLEPELPPVEPAAAAPDATLMMQAPERHAVPPTPPVPSEPKVEAPIPAPPPLAAPVFTPPAVEAPALVLPPVEPPPPVKPPAIAAEAPGSSAPSVPSGADADLSSSTLAELYFNQGFADKALAVYRQLLQREPGNERARARVTEIETLERELRAEEARSPEADKGGAGDPATTRRQAIERTIARLEGWLAAVKKGEA
jgi:tetratricopeptide (TPR) repeat protein